MERLTEEMLLAAAQCKVSKTSLWLRGALLGSQWKEEDLFKPEDEIHDVGFRFLYCFQTHCNTPCVIGS